MSLIVAVDKLRQISTELRNIRGTLRELSLFFARKLCGQTISRFPAELSG